MNELVGKLYALRAGLSVLSEEWDGVNACKAQYDAIILEEVNKTKLWKFDSDFVKEVDEISKEQPDLKTLLTNYGFSKKKYDEITETYSNVYQRDKEDERLDQLSDEHQRMSNGGRLAFARWLMTDSALEYYKRKDELSDQEKQKMQDEQIRRNKHARNKTFILTLLFAVGAAVMSYILNKNVCPFSQIYTEMLKAGGIFGAALFCVYLITNVWGGTTLADKLEYAPDAISYIAIGGSILGGLGFGGATLSTFIGNRADTTTIHGGLLLGGIFDLGILTLFYLIWTISYQASYRHIKRGDNDYPRKKRKYKTASIDEREAKRIACKEKLTAIFDKRQEEINAAKANADPLYFALKKQYATILDERDWQNLDLIIFELETRRADTMKEALLLVDKELQVQRIETAIHSATAQICHTLQTGFMLLENTLRQSYAALSMQIQQMNAQMVVIGTEIINNQRLNNALLEKANTTSCELMEHVRQLRSNSDHAAMRARNNF